MFDIAIGIDPGVSGAVAALYHGSLLSVDDTPTLWARFGRSRRRVYDVAAMRVMLERHMHDKAVLSVFIERQQAMPRQGVTSMFSTGYGYGLWMGLLSGLGIQHTVVGPRRWQAAMLAGRGDSKTRALIAASQLFPKIVIPKGRHGRADALLLAEFGRRLICGETAQPAAVVAG